MGSLAGCMCTPHISVTLDVNLAHRASGMNQTPVAPLCLLYLYLSMSTIRQQQKKEMATKNRRLKERQIPFTSSVAERTIRRAGRDDSWPTGIALRLPANTKTKCHISSNKITAFVHFCRLAFRFVLCSPSRAKGVSSVYQSWSALCR